MLKKQSKPQKEEINLWFYGTVILAALIVIAGSLYSLNYFGVISFSETSVKTVKNEIPETNISTKNREPAKSALNAIGEINSVASVGANYMQFSNAIQSAKIKFDIAMRDFESQTAEDEEIQRQLAGVFICYVDAKDAWEEFIEKGDKYGFLTPKSYSRVHKLSASYGFKPDKGDYYKDEVLRTILMQADRKFDSVKDKIK
jgi:hypothetical protein